MTGPPATRQPDTALRTLNRLVGTWRLSGDVTGTVVYRWMEGAFFLVQDGQLGLDGHHSTFTEIIGRVQVPRRSAGGVVGDFGDVGVPVGGW
jgi:hypothetical protein